MHHGVHANGYEWVALGGLALPLDSAPIDVLAVDGA